jgi:hypothetical protein
MYDHFNLYNKEDTYLLNLRSTLEHLYNLDLHLARSRSPRPHKIFAAPQYWCTVHTV